MVGITPFREIQLAVTMRGSRAAIQSINRRAPFPDAALQRPQSVNRRPDRRLESWVNGLAFQSENGVCTFVDAPQWLPRDESVQALQAEGKFAQC